MTQVKSLGDTTAAIRPRHLSEERVRVLARRQPLVVAPGTPLRDAIELMQAHGGECVLVCEDGRRLMGILTERDVLLRVLGREDGLSGPIDDYMTPQPHTIAPDATLRDAMAMMEEGGYRNLPLVEDGGRVVGLVRQQDLIEYVAEAFPQEILNLPPRPHQRMEAPEGA